MNYIHTSFRDKTSNSTFFIRCNLGDDDAPIQWANGETGKWLDTSRTTKDLERSQKTLIDLVTSFLGFAPDKIQKPKMPI